VRPTRLPLERFYQELVGTQRVLNMKHMGMRALMKTVPIVGRHLRHGQTNFIRMLWKFNSVYDPGRLCADHRLPVRYPIPLPPEPRAKTGPKSPYVHGARRPAHPDDRRRNRALRRRHAALSSLIRRTARGRVPGYDRRAAPRPPLPTRLAIRIETAAKRMPGGRSIR